MTEGRWCRVFTLIAMIISGVLRNTTLLAAALILLGPGPANSADVEQRIGVVGTVSQIRLHLRGWCSIKDWHPQVSNCETIADGASTYRLLTLTNGNRVKERLTEIFADGYSYEFIEGEPAITPYQAKIWVEKIRDHRTVIRWHAEFQDDAVEPDEARRINSFFYAGLANIKKFAIVRWRRRLTPSPLADPFILSVVLTWLGASVLVGWYTLRAKGWP